MMEDVAKLKAEFLNKIEILQKRTQALETSERQARQREEILRQQLLEAQAARLEAERSLQTIHQQLDSVLEILPNALIALDSEWRYTAMNRQAEKLLGTSSSALLGKKAWDTFSGLPGAQAYDRCHQAMAAQQPIEYEDFYPDFNKWFAIRLYPIATGLYTYFRDITEYKQAELEREQLLKLEQTARREAEMAQRRLEEIFRQLPALFSVLTGPEQVIEFANPTFLEVAGRSPDIIGKTDREAFPEMVDQRYFAIHDHVYQTGEVVEIKESQVRWDPQGDGNLVEGFFNFSYLPLRNTAGEVESVLTHGIEVTAQVRSRQQVETLLENLKQKEAELQLVVDSLPTLVSFVDPEGRYRLNNRAYEEWFGISRDELYGQFVRDVFSEEVWERIRPHMAAALSGQTVSYEAEIFYPQVGNRYVIVQYVPHISEQGEVLGFVVLVQDISDRKQAEVALREREEGFSTLFNGMDDWVLVYPLMPDHRPGKLIEVNERACQKLGYSREELLTMSVLDIVSPSAVQPQVSIERLLAEKHIVVESIHGTKDGRQISVEVSATLFTLNGLPTVQAICRDITERKQAENLIKTLNRDLQHRVNELQTLFDVIPVCVAIAEDSQGRIIRVNNTFAQILGISLTANASCSPPPDAPEPPYRVFHAGQELSAEEMPVQYAAMHGTEVRDFEIEIVRDDGGVINLLGHAAPLLNQQGQSRGAIAAFLDVTHIKRVEQEREQLFQREQVARQQAESANRIKDEFLAVLSHELRSPLNPILGWSQLLRTRTFDEQTTKNALATIERNAKLQTQLIEDLLDVSRILRGKMTLNVAPVHLANTIEAAIETVRLAAEAKGILIQTHLHAHLSPVAGDPSRLQQIFWNLLSNAVKFTPPQGRVEVWLQQVDSYVEIQVQDTGPGIDPEFLPYVFDYFRQADSKTTRKFGGLGLGLAIVRHLTELHGGTVQAASVGDGQGTTFTVLLPSMTVTSEPIHSVQHSTTTTHLNDLKVLVVDDEADMRDLVTVILNEYGAKVKGVGSATEALLALEQFQPDILVSDIGMPEVDGYMLMRQVRARPPEQQGRVPAIALTAYAGEFNQQQAIVAGFQRHIAKPISPQEFVEAIATLVSQPKL